MKTKILHSLAVAALALSPLVFSSCTSMAASSASSASVASLSASSAANSAARHSAYHEDVQTMSMIAAESGARSAELLRSVGQVAADHGIADWQSDSQTFYAIGKGLREAGLAEVELLAMADELTDANATAKARLLDGFRALA